MWIIKYTDAITFERKSYLNNTAFDSIEKAEREVRLLNTYERKRKERGFEPCKQDFEIKEVLINVKN